MLQKNILRIIFLTLPAIFGRRHVQYLEFYDQKFFYKKYQRNNPNRSFKRSEQNVRDPKQLKYLPQTKFCIGVFFEVFPVITNISQACFAFRYSGLERETGRAVLENLCLAKHHLKVPANVYVKKTSSGQHVLDIACRTIIKIRLRTQSKS